MPMGSAIGAWSSCQELGRGIASTLWFKWLPYSSIL